MVTHFEITKAEYKSILRNMGKSVSPSISMQSVVKKVKHLTKKDIKHLTTIRNIPTTNDDSVDDLIMHYLKIFINAN